MMPQIASPAPSALLTFSTENVRSFRDGFELSMLATALSERAVVRHLPWREGGKPAAVLPVAGIYGANASGKSNVLRAMDDMRQLVLGSFRHGSPTGNLPHRPFRLDRTAERQPSCFRLELILRGVRHEYGFRFDREQVVEEWAFHYPHGRPALLFRREPNEVELGSAERAKGRAVRDLLRPNALFLSTAASANHPLLLPLYEWFERNLLLAEADSRNLRQVYTARLLDDRRHREQVLAFLRAADLGIVDARLRHVDDTMRERLEQVAKILAGQDDEPGVVVEINDIELQLAHRGARDTVELPVADESLGTLVWLGLAGPVVQALAEGAVLLADELDASLHPALVGRLVRLFQDERTNPFRAQLVFNSHDATVMGDSGSDRPLGRDQIWFTEKPEDGATRLYPLSDLDPRKDEAIARRYLAGRYGAIPVLSPAEFEHAAELIASGARDDA